MLKPDAPFQATSSMADSLDFIQKLWRGMGMPGSNTQSGMMGIPGMVLPTISVEDIHKKIAELRAVESWLELNMGMLRSTIQTLEVQAATISTMQSMGESFNAAAQSMSSSFQPAEPEESESPPSDDRAMHAHPTVEPTAADEAEAAMLTAPLVNAAAWWGQLQDQFKQAVAHAMSEPPIPNGHDKRARPTRKSNVKAATKTPVKTTKAKAAAKTSTRKRKPTK